MRRALSDRAHRGFRVSLIAVLAGMTAAIAAQPAPASSEGPVSKGLDTTVRNSVVSTLAKDLIRDYAHANIGRKMAKAIRDRLARGDYDGIESPAAFASALTADVHAVAGDKHFRVWFSDGVGPRSPAIARTSESGMRRMNAAIPRVEILEGNIGYMEVDGMPPPQIAKPVMSAAFAFLHDTDALIIDLRANGGGDPQTDALYMSFLSGSPPFVVNRFHWRNPERVTETDTTILGNLSYGAQRPVFCLTSARTFSGGEELAYDVQAFKRGTVVGATTGGGANPSDVERLGHGFWALVPDGYVVNPVTGSNWEGRGVIPDVQVPADWALVTAERLAIAKLATRSPEPHERTVLGAVAQQLAVEQAAMQGHPAVEIYGAELVGAYRPLEGQVGIAPGGAGLTHVSRQRGQLFIEPGAPNMPPARLVPQGGNIYHLSGYPPDFIATFSRSPAGDVRLILDLSSARPAVILRRMSMPQVTVP